MIECEVYLFCVNGYVPCIICYASLYVIHGYLFLHQHKISASLHFQI
jgi:hypothetical protein